ncbi:MAG: polysaccharide biosynthesis protein [Parabacteroides sp.]|nr:polysaccharide biosynthesis protein [Parabacteroides sp.]
MNVLYNLSHWYFSKKALPYWGIYAIDCLVMFLSGCFIYFLDYGLTEVVRNWRLLGYLLLISWVFYSLGFRIFHTYSGIIRYSSFVDLQRVVYANLIGLIGSTSVCLILQKGLNLSTFRLMDHVMIFFITTALMWAFRVTIKSLFDMAYYSKKAKRVFIFGTKHGGMSLAKSIRSSEEAKYILDGFVTDDEQIVGKWLMGVKVYLNDETLVQTMRERHTNTLIVSPLYSEKLRRNETLVSELLSAGIHILMYPPTLEWDGKSDLNILTMKEVDIEDLLPREKIEIDMDKVGKQLSGQKILITGAAGSIGSEIVRQIAVYTPAELILLDQAETPLHDVRLEMARNRPNVKAHTIVSDISNQSKMEEIFQTFKPHYVFHAAAYKHVPMMEDNPSEAIQNNVYGTRVIADLAVKYGTKKFVMVSTDKAVNPTNVMGCSKRICEIYVQSLDKAIKEGRVQGITQFVTTRFGNVLGSNGSVIPLFKNQIKAGGPITVTHPDIIRFFMLIPEACKLVLEAGTMGNGGEIFIFDMGEPVRIVDLAKRMIKLSGAKDIEIQFTGLRDGEKLYEEVLNDMEVTKPTHHPKIKIAEVREYDYEEAKKNEERLLEASYRYDDMEIVRIMKEIVPEFKSQHSKYEALDR